MPENNEKKGNMREADANKSLTHERPEPKTKPPKKRPSSSSDQTSDDSD